MEGGGEGGREPVCLDDNVTRVCCNGVLRAAVPALRGLNNKLLLDADGPVYLRNTELVYSRVIMSK